MNEIIEQTTPKKQDIDWLEGELGKMEQAKDMVTNHYFANGMYCRELHRSKGTIIVGKVHKHEHFFFITKGKLAICGVGQGWKVFEAPSVIVSRPGTKRVTVALEDSTGMTIHRTDSKDLNLIEQEILEECPNALFDAHNELKKLGVI